MKKGSGVPLFLINGGMELSWLYAWATFLTTLAFHQSFPFKEAIGPFGLALVLTLFSRERGWWVIQILSLQLVGFILAALRIVYIFNVGSHSFWDKAWLVEFFNPPRPLEEWLSLLLLPLFAVMFWLGGMTLSKRSMAYSTLCSRFDLGIAAFFLLFLTKFLLRVKGEIKIEESMSQLLFFQFFIFGLLAVGLARNRGSAPKEFLPGYQSIGVILSFTAVVLLFGGGVVLFFLPYLKAAADVGYGVLKVAAKPVGYVLLQVLRFLYAPRGNQSRIPSPEVGLGDLKTSSEGDGLPEIVEKILAWGLGSLLGLAVFGVSCLILFYLFRWLFSRTSIRPKRQSPGLWYVISLWASRFRTFLALCRQGIVRGLRGYHKAAQLYSVLLSWGRHSGLPCSPSETPTEYGLRLKDQFPSLQREIGWIVGAFNQEVYGEIHLNSEQLATPRFAWYRLRSPAQWPSRLKARLHQSNRSKAMG
jgi:Domain of unknown function (DUF4129)